MDKEKELSLYVHLREIQRLSSYPIVVKYAHSDNFFVKANGKKQEVYNHMFLIRKRINFILKHFFEEEAMDGQ